LEIVIFKILLCEGLLYELPKSILGEWKNNPGVMEDIFKNWF
jgi:hypothetical protein